MLIPHEEIMGSHSETVVKNLPERMSHAVLCHALSHPDNICTVEEQRSMTYGELAAAVEEAKRFLQAHQVRGGDRVLLVAENSLVLLTFMMATSELDAWAVPVNSRLTDYEIQNIFDDCKPRLVIYTTEVSQTAEQHAKAMSHTLQTQLSSGTFIHSPTLEAAPEVVQASGKEQVFALIYTSGTTGKPKGVMLTHSNVLFASALSGRIRHLDEHSYVFAALPMSHSFGLTSCCLATLLYGGALYFEPKFSAQKCLKTLVDQKVTIFMGVPPMYSSLIDEIKRQGINTHELNLTYLFIGGASLDMETKRYIEGVFGMVLHNGYGLTETSPTVSALRYNTQLNNLSCGRPIPGIEIKLLAENGQEVQTGDVGELWTRGPHVMKGYYNKPEMTAAVLMDDGWLNTQDLARLDEDGNLYIVGRTKELIIRSGFNVYPAEVEAAINEHDSVIQSAVVGVTEDHNEVVIAFVQMSEGQSLSQDELRVFCKERLSPYKVPARFIFLDHFPASGSGKILKNQLKTMAEELCSSSTH